MAAQFHPRFNPWYRLTTEEVFTDADAMAYFNRPVRLGAGHTPILFEWDPPRARTVMVRLLREQPAFRYVVTAAESERLQRGGEMEVVAVLTAEHSYRLKPGQTFVKAG